jgi:SOS-response transcriptional repressor LexA|tara:strand:- start:1224 stop:1424 length:201 start_codon:yes stop_codon:yes gene_type:complete
MTKNESKVLKFIKKFIEENDYSPSYGEIADHMQWKSRSQSKAVIDSLVQYNRVKLIPAKKRSLELV